MDQIFNFMSFFGKIEQSLERKLGDFEKQRLDRDILKVEKIFQDYKTTAKGCTQKCKFCKKWCDHCDINEDHKHHANCMGHQPRIFAGAYVQKNDRTKIASKITCDLVDQQREVMINGVPRKWQEVLEISGQNDWNIVSGKQMSEFKSQLDAYEAVWRIHGKRICKKFNVQDDGKTIREFIKEYNMNMRTTPSHYIIVIDESGSMSINDNFGKALKGVKDFIQYLRKNIYSDACYVSLILFDHGCRVIEQAVLLAHLGEINVTMKQGGTNFEPVLNDCIKTVYSNKNKAEVTRIMVYTDGYASYPEKPISKIRQMIKSEGLDLKLHWFSAENVSTANPDNVFNKSRKFLGREHCTIDEEVKASHTASKFIEIFNIDK